MTIPRRRHRETWSDTPAQYLREGRLYDSTSGSWMNPWTPYEEHDEFYPYNPSEEVSEDFTGFYGSDNPLSIVKRWTSPGRTVGYVPEYSSDLGDGYTSYSRASFNQPHFTLPYGYDDMSRLESERIQFATAAAAGVNPSAAKFDAAIFLGELRDLPSLFKSTFSGIMKAGAGEYLKYQYGWKPLIKDLRNYFRVVNIVDKRLRTLERLKKDSLLRLPYRTKDHEVLRQSFTSERRGDFTAISHIPVYSHHTECVTERWGIVEFVPEIPRNLVSLPADTDLKAINRALYGGVVDGNTLWQLMPWSWLYDWNHNVSDFLESQRNVVGAKVSKVLIMETVRLQSTATLVNWQEGGDVVPYPVASSLPAFSAETRKSRFTEYKPAVVSTGGLDLLVGSDFKTSILTALAIQRLKILP